MAAQIHADYRQKDLIHEQERQQQGRGEYHHDADDKDLLKIKFPSLGDNDPDKDAKIGSKEYLIWKKAVRIWEATTRVHPGRIGVHLVAAMKGRARNAVLLALSEGVIASERGTMAVMDELGVLYLGDLASQAWTLTGDLIGIKKKTNESMEDFISRFRQGCFITYASAMKTKPYITLHLLLTLPYARKKR